MCKTHYVTGLVRICKLLFFNKIKIIHLGGKKDLSKDHLRRYTTHTPRPGRGSQKQRIMWQLGTGSPRLVTGSISHQPAPESHPSGPEPAQPVVGFRPQQKLAQLTTQVAHPKRDPGRLQTLLETTPRAAPYTVAHTTCDRGLFLQSARLMVNPTHEQANSIQDSTTTGGST